MARHVLELRRTIPSATGGNWPRQERLYCQVQRPDGTVGYGEAAPHPVTGPRLDDIEEDIRRVGGHLDSNAWPEVLAMAMLDASSKAAGVPAWHSLDCPSPAPDGYVTVTTYGGTDLERLRTDIASDNPAAIKLKLTGGNADLLIAGEVWRAFHRPLVLDVNGAWSWDVAMHHVRALEAAHLDVLWIEQPCPATAFQGRLPTTIPIFADEALDDAPFDWDVYDGIVLKPARSGLSKCRRFGRMARDRGKRVTLGCHLQSSLLTAATLSLGGFVTERWVDLDSAILVAADPFTGPTIDAATSRIRLGTGSGLAIEPAAQLPWTFFAAR